MIEKKIGFIGGGRVIRFIALHPPAVIPALDEIKSALKQESVLISLAPKITISKISEKLEALYQKLKS